MSSPRVASAGPSQPWPVHGAVVQREAKARPGAAAGPGDTKAPLVATLGAAGAGAGAPVAPVAPKVAFVKIHSFFGAKLDTLIGDRDPLLKGWMTGRYGSVVDVDVKQEAPAGIVLAYAHAHGSDRGSYAGQKAVGLATKLASSLAKSKSTLARVHLFGCHAALVCADVQTALRKVGFAKVDVTGMMQNTTIFPDGSPAALDEKSADTYKTERDKLKAAADAAIRAVMLKQVTLAPGVTLEGMKKKREKDLEALRAKYFTQAPSLPDTL